MCLCTYETDGFVCDCINSKHIKNGVYYYMRVMNWRLDEEMEVRKSEIKFCKSVHYHLGFTLKVYG